MACLNLIIGAKKKKYIVGHEKSGDKDNVSYRVHQKTAG